MSSTALAKLLVIIIMMSNDAVKTGGGNTRLASFMQLKVSHYKVSWQYVQI